MAYRIKKRWGSRFDDDAYLNRWGEKTDHFGAERFESREDAENARSRRAMQAGEYSGDYEVSEE